MSEQFMADVTERRYNHAYQLLTDTYKQTRDNKTFRSVAMPKLTEYWPSSKPIYRTAQTVDDNHQRLIYSLPSDGDAAGQTVILDLTRTGAGQPWGVDAIISMAGK